MNKRETRYITKTIATLYLFIFVIWCFLASIGIFNYPCGTAIFFAGMEFEYLATIHIIPWLKGEEFDKNTW